MNARQRLLARLLPLVLPIAGCGGNTAADTAQTATGGASGQGGSAAGEGGGGDVGGSSVAGTGGSAGGAGGGGGGVAGEGGGASCPGDQPYDGDLATGFFVCSKGTHRPSKGTCSASIAPADPTCAMYPDGQCKTNDDCSVHPFGSCGYGAGGLPGCSCNYGCATDADCASGQICLCGTSDSLPACVQASCSTDADCGSGSLCLLYTLEGPCSYDHGFACSTPADECTSDLECGPGDGNTPHYCTFDGTKRVCAQVQGVCGRPILVEGSARLARLSVGSRSWSLA